jgi:DNA-binding SARP family transcriptional activator
MDPPTLRVSLLGGFDLRHGPNAVGIRSARVRSLVSWLALHARTPQPRTRVASALWPDTRDAQARTNLRNLLHQMRRGFPDIDLYLDTAGTDLCWRAAAPVIIDVDRFERAIVSANDAHGIESALALHTGPLLPDDYDDWLSAERDRLARLYVGGLDALLDERLRAGDYAKALDDAARILDADPLHERAWRGRIIASAALGDRAGASRAWQACRTVLARELGVEPDEATADAWRAALGSSSPRASVEPASPRDFEARSGRAGRGKPDAPAEARFVGRARELESLDETWRRTCDSQSGMVWVTGEPGIGKTRLVHAFADRLRRDGIQAVEARAYPTLGALAYGPVVAWLRAPIFASALARATSAARRQLARLLPELDAGAAGNGFDDELTEAERRQRLHDAVIPVLSHPEAPRVLILDDIQWSDRESVDLLSGLLLRATRPLLVLATLRTGETDSDQPLMRMGTRMRAAGLLRDIALQPLGVNDTGAILRDLGGRTATAEDAAALHRQTEGNPLFIVETIRSGRPLAADAATPESAGPAVPRIRAVIEARLNLLAPESLLVTRIAASIGREFTLPLLLAVSPLDEDATIGAVDEAWRRMLVREREDGVWDFTHGRIREVAVQTSRPAQRRGWHRDIARVLERSLGGRAPAVDAGPDQVALHYDLGDVPSKAVGWYRRAA